MRTLTMKFGGSSVGTTTALTQVVSIVLQECERWDRLVVVASALEGVTDALLEAAQLARLANRRGYRRIVATIRTRHLALVEELSLSPNERSSLQADIDNLLFDMLDICQALADSAAEETIAPETVDAIISVGERLAARIIAALIRNNGLRSVAVDTADIIITDRHFGSANPDMELTQKRVNEYLIPMLDRDIIPVLTGFIGSTPGGEMTTLGRGGSDYTASIITVCTNAQEMWMWTDVDGMMSSDPHEVPAAQVIPELSYEEIAEMSYFGARIVHSRMIGLLQERRIPMRIKNVYRPQYPGTLVHHISRSTTSSIKAVTSIQGIGLYTRHSGALGPIYEVLNKVIQSATGFPAEVTISTQSSTHSFVSVVIPPSAGPSAVGAAEQAFTEHFNSREDPLGGWNITQVSIITVIGSVFSEHPQIAGRILSAIEDIPMMAISQGPDSCSLSLVFATRHAAEALERIHAMVV